MPRIDFYPTAIVSPYRPGGEPAWSIMLGDMLVGSYYLVSPLLWWGTGCYKIGAASLVAIVVLMPMPAIKMACWCLKRRPQPEIIYQ